MNKRSLLVTLATLAAAVVLASSYPYPYPYPGEEDNRVDDDYLDIDVSYLGEAAYRTPSQAAGERVSRWDPRTSRVNPEELGGLAEGDMRFDGGLGRNGLRDSAKRWHKGIVPYVIDGSYGSDVRQKIMEAIADFHRLSCVRFVPRTSEPDYIVIVPKNTGCWSHVGKIGGMQEVNLQVPGCTSMKGTINHELLHALGFLHEQSRHERDNFVSIHTQNIRPGEEYNFKKADEKTTNDFGVEYDYHSVMHYGKYAFSVNNNPTISTKRGNVEIGQREGMSKGDVKKLNAMYGCTKENRRRFGGFGGFPFAPPRPQRRYSFAPRTYYDNYRNPYYRDFFEQNPLLSAIQSIFG